MKKILLSLCLLTTIYCYGQKEQFTGIPDTSHLFVISADENNNHIAIKSNGSVFVGDEEIKDSAQAGIIRNVLYYMVDLNKIFLVRNPETGEEDYCETSVCGWNRHYYSEVKRKNYNYDYHPDSVAVTYDWVTVDSIPYYFSHYDRRVGAYVLFGIKPEPFIQK